MATPSSDERSDDAPDRSGPADDSAPDTGAQPVGPDAAGSEQRSDGRAARGRAPYGAGGVGRSADQGAAAEGHAGPPGPDSTDPPDDHDDFIYDVARNRRLRTEAERGRRSLYGVPTGPGGRTLGENSGNAAMGDNSFIVGGSVGTINIRGGPRVGPRARAVSPQTISQLRAVFVDTLVGDGTTTSRTQLVQRLAPDPVVPLIGPEGSGRTSLALCALADVRPGTDVALFDPGTDPTRITAADLKPDIGYVLDATAAARRDQFGLVVGELNQLAKAKNARLVLIVDEQVGTRALAVGDAVRHQMPAQNEVLRRLLRHQHHVSDERIAGLPQPCYDAVTGAPLRRVAEVAALVAAALQDDRAAGDYLHDQVRRQAADLFRDPLAGVTDQDRLRGGANLRLFRRAFLVALAVCNGMPLDQVAQAATRLCEVLNDGRPATRLGSAFTEPTEELLEWAGATAVGPEAGEETRVGDAGRVRFRNPAMAGVVLDLIWDSHHLDHEGVLTWLANLAVIGRHSAMPEPVRLRAALAVGRLATHDFDQIMTSLVERWIKRSLSGRRAAAWAVEEMIENPEISGRAWDRVQRWSNKGQLWREAALLVHATAPGARRTEDALDLVRRTAAISQRGWSAFAMAVTSVVAAADGMDQVFDLLAGWVAEVEAAREQARRFQRQGRRNLRVHSPAAAYGAGCLLLLMSDSAAGGTRETLLGHVGTDPERRTVLDALWQLLLTVPGLAPLGWLLLRSWIEEMDGRPVEAARIRDLLLRLRATEPIRSQFPFYATRWRHEWATANRLRASRDMIDDLLEPTGDER